MKITKLKIENSRKSKPRIMVLSGYGLNCEEETKFAFDSAGGSADIVHINDLIMEPDRLKEYQILAFPGGFSYGDDTGSGKAYANKFKNHLSKELAEFLSRDTLVIGICNGFQIITNLGILPGGLTYNKGGKYLDRWVDLKVSGSPRHGRARSPWLTGIDKLSVPIAHGEGCYIISKKEYGKIKKAGEIAFTYDKGEICNFQNLPANPNGSNYDIAGVLNYSGRVLGMMPHPERGMFVYQSPLWYKNNKKDKRKWGDGLAIFKNGVNYFRK